MLQRNIWMEKAGLLYCQLLVGQAYPD